MSGNPGHEKIQIRVNRMLLERYLVHPLSFLQILTVYTAEPERQLRRRSENKSNSVTGTSSGEMERIWFLYLSRRGYGILAPLLC